ncbi:chaplin [Nocardiopsis sp. HNM0947]|uniref:Chaplin n=1 Tax=Nocardiopsis coralli TaxID=2772213 RepID=A0ABR9P1X6_9ACTN|nr:chaplin family protein [Nocardiopsis coralli]MBE2997842.1 chaplin [Nocardiopsis coralli]
MLKKALAASAIAAAAGGVLFTGAPAMAGDVATSGNGGIVSGNQLVADLDVPVNACGNSIGLLGISSANCAGSGATVK